MHKSANLVCKTDEHLKKGQLLLLVRSNFENPFELRLFCLWNGFHMSCLFQCCMWYIVNKYLKSIKWSYIFLFKLGYLGLCFGNFDVHFRDFTEQVLLDDLEVIHLVVWSLGTRRRNGLHCRLITWFLEKNEKFMNKWSEITDILIRESYEEKFWISVPVNCNIRKIFSAILDKLKYDALRIDYLMIFWFHSNNGKR